MSLHLLFRTQHIWHESLKPLSNMLEYFPMHVEKLSHSHQIRIPKRRDFEILMKNSRQALELISEFCEFRDHQWVGQPWSVHYVSRDLNLSSQFFMRNSSHRQLLG